MYRYKHLKSPSQGTTKKKNKTKTLKKQQQQRIIISSNIVMPENLYTETYYNLLYFTFIIQLDILNYF